MFRAIHSCHQPLFNNKHILFCLQTEKAIQLVLYYFAEFEEKHREVKVYRNGGSVLKRLKTDQEMHFAVT